MAHAKIKLNKYLCTPCSVVIGISKKLKNETVSKDHITRITASISSVLLVIFLFFWIFSHTPGRLISASHNAARSLVNAPVDQSFLFLYNSEITRTNTGRDSKGEPFTDKLEDKFSHANFLHLKLRNLISLSYLSSAYPIVRGKKNQAVYTVSDHQLPFSNTNFSFLLNELNVIIRVQNFYLRKWGCHEIDPIEFPNPVLQLQHSITGNLVHDGQNLALQTSKVDVDELIAAKCGSSDSENSRSNTDRCFLLKNRRMLQQYLFLEELSHPNIVRLLGVCIPSNPIGSKGVILAKEAGVPAEINHLKSLSWSQRLKICYDVVNLALYFSKSPLGSIMLESWEPNNFVLVSDSSTIKLSNFDQKIQLLEMVCTSDQDCSIGNIRSATKCSNGVCAGYNEKANLHKIYSSFIQPVLQSEIPTRISDDANNVFDTLKSLRCNSTILLQLLKFLQPTTLDLPGNKDTINSNILPVGPMKRLPDGMQVDSWEQHESHVAINEVDFNQLQQVDVGIQQDIMNFGMPQEEQNNVKENFGYEKIENADYPGRYDYYCPHSKAEWGCVVSLRKLEEAAKKCDDDPKCKGFVTMPHLRKEGWIIVILKSDNTRAVDHAGTTVYIKVSGDIASQKEIDTGDGGYQKDSSDVVKLCLQDLVQSQESVRELREQQLMKPCGWEGMSDSKWQSTVLEATVRDATTFKPSRGKMAIGGQMNMILDSSIKMYPALFLAKKGPEEFHLAQLTTYHLDRMLGLYKTIPAFLRTLTEQEMTDAGFPVDIGGNQFDVFRQLKNADKSLSGTIVPTISDRISVEHYISVPKLGRITNAVTPFSRRQWDDLEYLLLMWLASLPMPTKGHLSIHGHLVHIKTDEAFKSEPAPVVLSYFNNCQFPRIAVDVLRNLRTAHCNFGDQLVARVRTAYPDLQQNAFSFQVPVADIATRNANRLLEVVDLCVRKFGDNIVLYDS